MTDPLPGDIFTVGQVLNNTYQIDRILGRGGTGEVYLASNQITGRQVAIKALNAAFSGNADYIELMKREEEMRAIQHDAVVRYTECSRSDDGHVFLVMDFVDGPPLSDVMATRQMDPRALLIIAHRVLEGLEATHHQGIIHRDLSPDNVVLRGGDPAEATLIDFGIAKDTAAGARTIVGSDFAGKYEYSAPEQFEGTADARTDLYALGATLLAAFRGETPFVRATPGEIIRRKQSPLDTQGVPDPLKGVIDKLTHPNPKERPENAAVMAAEVSHLLNPNKRDTRDKSKRRFPLVPVLGGIGAVIVGVIVWNSGYFDPPPPPPEPQTYQLSLTFDHEAPPVFSSLAPTEIAAATLRDAVTAAYGQIPGGEMTIAPGMPSDAWVAQASELVTLLADLDNGALQITTQNARITGLAADLATKSELTNALDRFETATNWQVASDIIAGPVTVTQDQLLGAIEPMVDCGTLSLSGGAGSAFALSDVITLRGDVAEQASLDRVVQAMTPLIGERPIIQEVRVLNAQLCAIRSVLNGVPTDVVSITMSNGETGERNLSGVFTTGQNPVVDVVIPDRFAQGALWVLAINPDGSVFNVVPNIYNEEFRIDALANAEAGLHRIRVLHSIEAFSQNNQVLAFRIQEGEYGKSEIVAILSRESLFDGRRPTTESVGSVVQALTEVLETRPENILGVTSSIVDARP